MKTRFVTSLFLYFIAGTWAMGCSSSSKSPAANGPSGGQTSTGGASSDSGSDEDSGPQDTTLRAYDSDDPNLTYVGRIDFTNPKAPAFSAPGVYITVRFKGVAVNVKVKSVSSSSNYFDLVVDGVTANSVKIQTSGNTDYIQGAKDLPYQEHTVTLVKRTEANPGPTAFLGFQFAGTILPAPSAKPHKIEVIGDSISAGSGNMAGDGSANCQNSTAYSDANLSYGPILARQLNADYHVTAVSGIGLIRNYNCGNPNTMPVVYDRVYFEQSSNADAGTNVWDTADYEPEAILIGLGTNDFSPDDCSKPALNETVDPVNFALWQATLKSFILRLRSAYGSVNGGQGPDIFLLASPMLNDKWPNDTYTSDTSHRQAMLAVANDVNGNTTGIGKVHVFSFDTDQKNALANVGCGTHPLASDHAKIAADILPSVKSAMGW